jgi:hypothetical protein
LNGSYNLPFGKGRKYANQGGFLNLVIGGWTTSMTFIAETGPPFSMNSSITTANGASSHPVLIRDPFKGGGSLDPRRTDYRDNSGNPLPCPAKVRNTVNWYNPCAFINAPPASAIPAGSKITGYAALAYLGAPRNTVYGPGYERINGSLFKDFPIFREATLQFRMDYFNLLNTPAYANPNGNIGGLTGGQITSSRSLGQFYPDSRFFQFAGKINF